MNGDLDWMNTRRPCSELDEVEADAIFFPHHNSDALEAKAICRGCPVWRDCRKYARKEGVEFGVWGGETEKERKAAAIALKFPKRPNQPTPDPRCGSYAGIKAHRARREQFCRPCKDEKAAYERKRSQRMRDQEKESA